jgi:hypothetical protein
MCVSPESQMVSQGYMVRRILRGPRNFLRTDYRSVTRAQVCGITGEKCYRLVTSIRVFVTDPLRGRVRHGPTCPHKRAKKKWIARTGSNFRAKFSQARIVPLQLCDGDLHCAQCSWYEFCIARPRVRAPARVRPPARVRLRVCVCACARVRACVRACARSKIHATHMSVRMRTYLSHFRARACCRQCSPNA